MGTLFRVRAACKSKVRLTQRHRCKVVNTVRYDEITALNISRIIRSV